MDDQLDGDADIRAALGDGSGGDSLAKAVARARVASKLFSEFEPVTFGRYQLLDRVGSGGIGVVWGAWDPDLERRVAIKVLRPTIAIARDRVLAEGQTLAKLSDPNVVPIYDVGVLGDEVYLVMEWVRGQTLRAYCAEPRSVREIVDVYRQAGAGLAAAHRAGIVHCDFKPDNAILGADARVRVLDFGLAALASNRDGFSGGTPRYQAPEQTRGAPLTFASDQFAFAASLGEALTARGEVPRWLAAIVARGSAAEAGARFESFDALLRELSRDPAVIRRRRVIAVTAAGVAVAAFAIGRVNSSSAPETCSGSEQEIASAWSPIARANVVDHLRALGPYGASIADALATDLDARGAEWVASHRNSCQAHQRGKLTTDFYEHRLGCLSRSRAGLAASADVLASTSLADLDHTLAAVRSEHRPRDCEHDAPITAPRPAPLVAARVEAIGAAVSRARVFGIARRPEAMAAVRRATADARATGYVPLVTEALLVETRVASLVDEEHAVAPAQEALADAIALGDDPRTLEAFARLAFAVSEQEHGQLDGITLIDPIAKRTGDAARFARALLANNLGVFFVDRGDRVAARARFDTALAEARQVPGDPDAELASIPFNLALISTDVAEANRFAHSAAEARARLLGDNHADTLAARMLAVMLSPDRSSARGRLRTVCDAYTRFQSHLRAEIADCAYELGILELDLDEPTAASAAMRGALDDPLAERRPIAAIARGLEDALGAQPANASTELERLADTLELRGSRADRRAAADARAVAAIGWQRAREPDKARAAWGRARELIAAIARPIYHRRLAWLTREAAR